MELNKKVIIRADRAGVFYGTIIRKDGDEVELKEAMYIVEFFMEEFCTKFDIVIDPDNPNSRRHVTFLKEELWGTKIYDLQSEARAYKLQCSHEYFA